MNDFIKKLHALQRSTPHLGENNINVENSPYCQYCGYTKNCYLLTGSEHDEDCYYGNWLYFCKDCIDCHNTYKCELCHDCIDCSECYNCNECQDCQTCTDCEQCFDCKGCKNCYGCAGLRNKEYYFLNEKVTPEEFEKRAKESPEEIFKKTPRLASRQTNTENCTGDYIQNSKNSPECFEVKEMEDCGYCDNCIKDKDCYDLSNCYFGCELSYEVMSAIQVVNCNFCYSCHYCSDVEHSEMCYHCKNCFGCVSLRGREYYILNEPYSQEEYHKKVAEIKAATNCNQYLIEPNFPYEDSKAYQFFE